MLYECQLEMVGLGQTYECTYLAKPIHSTVVANTHYLLGLHVAGLGYIRRIMNDDMGAFSLNNMYRNIVCPAQRLDFWFSSPNRSIAHCRAVVFEFLGTHQTGFTVGR